MPRSWDADLQGATAGRPKSDHSSGIVPFPRYSTEDGGHLGPRVPGFPHGDEEVEGTPSGRWCSVDGVEALMGPREKVEGLEGVAMVSREE